MKKRHTAKNTTKMAFGQKLSSRKFWLAFVTLLVATLLLGIPPWFGQVLLSGTQWVSVVSIVFTAYFVTNTLQKRYTASGETNEEA